MSVVKKKIWIAGPIAGKVETEPLRSSRNQARRVMHVAENAYEIISYYLPARHGTSRRTGKGGLTRGWLGLAINFAPMTDADYKHDQHGILNLANEPVVANPIAPQARHCALERLADVTRVTVALSALVKKLQNAPLRGSVQA